ncbi:PfkB protein [Catenovulum agarivorans DS-2]|uniref:PfkB protein n=1 Tax=Catenovulum agarivorans DS-2 TaxID=1328313 RepID=W7QG32_9ALTE|nr:carbohydrate kinase [Catenovulum agarivorans]EWH11889.1 PfkB protein [Catenovulum agarivorans DS-2]
MKKVVCIGEMLIDFVSTDIGTNLVEAEQFLKKPGGAPANVAACVAKLGGISYFAGAVGNDPFGTSLINELIDFNVNIEYVHKVTTPTTLAFISLAQNGERDFVFNRGADAEFTLPHNQTSLLLENSILHLGSATALLGSHLFESYLTAAKYAHDNKHFICFDPNYREDLWNDNLDVFIQRSMQLIEMANFVKVSEEELALLTEEQDLAKGCDYLHTKGVNYITVTIGSRGCFLSTPTEKSIIPAYEITPVDTTGAGDSFIGAVLYQLSQANLSELTYAELAGYVQLGNKVSGVVCEYLGPMTGLTDFASIQKLDKALKAA